MRMRRTVLVAVASLSVAAMVNLPAFVAQAATTQSSVVASLANTFVSVTKAAIAANSAETLQVAVEQGLEGALSSAQPSVQEAFAALDAAEAQLKSENLWTPPVAAAFATARAAVASLLKPAAGAPGSGLGLGNPPSVSGGGGSQTGTYATSPN